MITDDMWRDLCGLAKVCQAAGAGIPLEELKSLQVGKVAEEAGEAMHALHGLKGLTTCEAECGPEGHSWDMVVNDLTGAVIASLLAIIYIKGEDAARAEFEQILHRRTRRGREEALAA